MVKTFKELIQNIEENILDESKNGLWANIHAKRERIKNGSGERMRKPGEKGAPTEKQLKLAAESISVAQGTTGKRVSWNPPLQDIRMADGTIKKLPPGKSGSSGGGGDGGGS